MQRTYRPEADATPTIYDLAVARTGRMRRWNLSSEPGCPPVIERFNEGSGAPGWFADKQSARGGSICSPLRLSGVPMVPRDR